MASRRNLVASTSRYIGAGAVATAGILTVLARDADDGFGAFVSGGPRNAKQDICGRVDACLRTDRDLPGGFVFGAIAVVILVPALVPGSLAETWEC